MIEAGGKGHQITLRQAVESRNARGDVIRDWANGPQLLRWSSMKLMAGSERVLGEKYQGTAEYEFRMRWAPNVEPLKWRIEYQGRVFDIRIVNDLEGRNAETWIRATEELG